MASKRSILLSMAFALVLVMVAAERAEACSGDDCGCGIAVQECLAACPPGGASSPCVAACREWGRKCAICCCCTCYDCPSYCSEFFGGGPENQSAGAELLFAPLTPVANQCVAPPAADQLFTSQCVR